MEFVDTVQERLDSREREIRQMQLANEARRLGAITPRGPFAHLDSLIIRAGKGATQRQARRGFSNHQELLS